MLSTVHFIVGLIGMVQILLYFEGFMDILDKKPSKSFSLTLEQVLTCQLCFFIAA